MVLILVDCTRQTDVSSACCTIVTFRFGPGYGWLVRGGSFIGRFALPFLLPIAFARALPFAFAFALAFAFVIHGMADISDIKAARTNTVFRSSCKWCFSASPPRGYSHPILFHSCILPDPSPTLSELAARRDLSQEVLFFSSENPYYRRQFTYRRPPLKLLMLTLRNLLTEGVRWACRDTICVLVTRTCR